MSDDHNPHHEKIARRAYEIFVAEGRPNGREVEHWKQAEAELAAAALTEAVGETGSLQI